MSPSKPEKLLNQPFHNQTFGVKLVIAIIFLITMATLLGFILFFFLLNSLPCYESLPPKQKQKLPPSCQSLPNLSEHPVILVVSFDGFRYDYSSKAPTPVLDELRQNGVRVPYMEPVWPTMTFPNHQSIATGLLPEVHGIVDNLVFDPLFNETLNGFGDDPGYWNYDPDVLPIWVNIKLFWSFRERLY